MGWGTVIVKLTAAALPSPDPADKTLHPLLEHFNEKVETHHYPKKSSPPPPLKSSPPPPPTIVG